MIIPEDLHYELSVNAARWKTSMQNIVEEALRDSFKKKYAGKVKS